MEGSRGGPLPSPDLDLRKGGQRFQEILESPPPATQPFDLSSCQGPRRTSRPTDITSPYETLSTLSTRTSVDPARGHREISRVVLIRPPRTETPSHPRTRPESVENRRSPKSPTPSTTAHPCPADDLVRGGLWTFPRHGLRNPPQEIPTTRLFKGILEVLPPPNPR